MKNGLYSLTAKKNDISLLCNKVLYLRHYDPRTGTHTGEGNDISLNEVFEKKLIAQIPHVKTNVQLKCN
jgi:hypothetical protein